MHRVIITYDGCPTEGFKFQGSYVECLNWIRDHIEWFESKYEDFYALDIVNVESGRLVSWILR